VPRVAARGGDCGVEDGIPLAVFDGGWNPGRRPWTRWWWRGPLDGLVASLGLVVMALTGGRFHGGTELCGTVVSHKVQSLGDEG
jgi:hypothetical protein